MPDQTPLDRINLLPSDAARDELLKCCGSNRWATGMVTARPYRSARHMIDLSDQTFSTLTQEDWWEAFSHHPKIGDINSLRAKFANTRAWASGEQSGVNVGSENTLRELADGNEDYLKKFGYIFIVCATGKSADEMLAILKQRLANEPANELNIAAEEQKKITRIRIEKLLKS
jgi:2-oxo-4-hydroxy-4-carboxy-5-ureidoimidazoline decarboxylase